MSQADGKLHTRTDSPVSVPQDDNYGFSLLAKVLAGRIMALSPGVSSVIGIEGKWGAGKTSLLNLLLLQLNSTRESRTHVLPISPWLSPPGSPMIESLLIPVAAYLDDYESRRHSALRRGWQRLIRAKASPLAKDLLRYARQASGGLAPLAEFAGNFVPGAGLVAQGMKTVSRFELSEYKETTEQLRQRIEKGIVKFGVNFIVIIDDLDRLEPSQAVEVLRLVRSVADFSGFRYIMCYDPDVLAHAVVRELGVADGRLYLQKIIPLSFSLPYPESFDLQREFHRGATELYAYVNSGEPGAGEQEDLLRAVGVYGQTLSTPREVSLVLNALAFRYSEIRDYVYFPDLCTLQIIRVTNPSLHDCIERYLVQYSVVINGEGTVSDETMERFSEEFLKHLASYGGEQAASWEELGYWVPGLSKLVDSRFVFHVHDERQKQRLLEYKRLASHTYWRYYFALSAPQNVLPPEYLNLLLSDCGRAGNDVALAAELLGKIRYISISRMTWFEHIISQLTDGKIGTLNFTQCDGLLQFFFNYSDAVAEKMSMSRRPQYAASHLSVVCHLMRRMLGLKRQAALFRIRQHMLTGKSRYWLVIMMSDLLWGHGVYGDQEWYDVEKPFIGAELPGLQDAVAMRMRLTEMQSLIFDMPDIGRYLYAWREIDNECVVSQWVRDVIDSDEGFINVLDGLCGVGYHSYYGRYRTLSPEDIEIFIGPLESVVTRLTSLTHFDRFSDKAAELLKALRRSRNSGPRL
ncbi:KAP family P-loop NTPase fold protein [Yokenella regensburgei]|jgi:hypothetical protein|uniref:KAP family P-loop NTPase fold protein n=1 Tax=Yokenella regensburgei TaxID=158877 RepID=UPI0002422615|nr:P-loop NTPase fold protein [Yokenella regensburgei]EHM50899.1 P-loop domain protein, KAP family [Yokenella regensburgei ATCC 43003]